MSSRCAACVTGVAGRPRDAVRATVVTLAALVAAGAVQARELITGVLRAEPGVELVFSLDAEDRRNVVGGRIALGEDIYEIAKVSRHGLVGARRFDEDAGVRYGEFVIFSSSFSDQTAVGRPWVAATRAWHCDEPYNSFIAVYRVDGEAELKALGPVPYAALTDDATRSVQSTVYCFNGRPATP